MIHTLGNCDAKQNVLMICIHAHICNLSITVCMPLTLALTTGASAAPTTQLTSPTAVRAHSSCPRKIDCIQPSHDDDDDVDDEGGEVKPASSPIGREDDGGGRNSPARSSYQQAREIFTSCSTRGTIVTIYIQ